MMRHRLSVSALLVAGGMVAACADGNSVVAVTVTGCATDVEHLEVVVMLGTTTARPPDFRLDGGKRIALTTRPTRPTFAVVFDARWRGRATIDVTAYGDRDKKVRLGHGTGEVDIVPSERRDVEISLGDAPACDMAVPPDIPDMDMTALATSDMDLAMPTDPDFATPDADLTMMAPGDMPDLAVPDVNDGSTSDGQCGVSDLGHCGLGFGEACVQGADCISGNCADGGRCAAVTMLSFNTSNSYLVCTQACGDMGDMMCPSDCNDVVMGDFDGDHKLDVAVNIVTAVRMMKGDGKGKLAALASVGYTAVSLGTLAVSDFNRDGYTDIAITHNGDTFVTILPGGPKGLADGQPVSTTLNSSIFSLVAGDLNGDTYPDLVGFTCCGGNGGVAVLLNTASMKMDASMKSFGFTLVNGKPYSFGQGNALAVGDFNGDGHPDVVISNNFNVDTISVALGDVNGMLSPTVNVGTGAALDITTGNLNDGGFMDVITNKGIFLGQKNTPYLAGLGQISPTTTKGAKPGGVVVADFDLDGNLDVAVAEWYDGTVVFLRGDGKGNVEKGGTAVPIGYGADQLAVGDLNGDGLPDVVATHQRDGKNTQWDGMITVLLNQKN